MVPSVKLRVFDEHGYLCACLLALGFGIVRGFPVAHRRLIYDLNVDAFPPLELPLLGSLENILGVLRIGDPVSANEH